MARGRASWWGTRALPVWVLVEPPAQGLEPPGGPWLGQRAEPCGAWQ